MSNGLLAICPFCGQMYSSKYENATEDMLIVCNNENKLNNLRFNRTIKQGDFEDYIFGTFFVCGMGTEDYCSLTDEQVERAIKRFALQKKKA